MHMHYPQQRYKYQPWVQRILDIVLAFDAVAFKTIKSGFEIENCLYFDIEQSMDSYQDACDFIENCNCHDVTKELIKISESVDILDLRTVFNKGYIELRYRKKIGDKVVVPRRRVIDFNQSNDIDYCSIPFKSYTAMRFADCMIDDIDIADEMNRLDTGCSIELAAAMLNLQEGELHFELF